MGGHDLIDPDALRGGHQHPGGVVCGASCPGRIAGDARVLAHRLQSYQAGEVLYTRSARGRLFMWQVGADGQPHAYPCRDQLGLEAQPDDGRGWPGLFVVFEGGEAAGKTTQAALLATRLRERFGVRVHLTREPGGTKLGARIRELVVGDGDMCARAEALLYAADRAQHIHEILPLLRDGVVVISDRHVGSSIAYQGAARGLGEREIEEISAWATAGVRPDVTVLLDVAPQVGLQRVRERGAPDRFERLGVDFHELVRLSLLRQAQDRSWMVVPSGMLVDDAAAVVLGSVGRLVEDRMAVRG